MTNLNEFQKMKTFESAMQLRELKIGEPLTKRQYDAVEFLLGSLLEPLRKLKPEVIEITFPNGEPKVTKDGKPWNGMKVSRPCYCANYHCAGDCSPEDATL